MDDQEYLTYASKIVKEAQKRGARLRLLGSVAFNIHCPTYGHFQEKAGRHFTDLDFAAYFSDSQSICQTLEAMNFYEDREVATTFARSRLIYHLENSGLYVDVFFDKLDFCHPIYWKGLLELDSPTLPLAELLLEKMQIVQINEKDIIDTVMLLREHPLGDHDRETINVLRILNILANDWGFWRTVTMNLSKVIDISKQYTWLDDADHQVVTKRVEKLLKMIDDQPKSIRWKLRDKIGDRVRWYNEIPEVAQ